jgi:hypothetical protein
VNDWKEADYVFHFGEHILPDRSMFALVQGLRMQEATTGMLGATKNRNSASITAIAPIIWTVTSIRGSSRFVPQPLPI